MANYFLNDVELSQYLLLLGDPKIEHTNSTPSSSSLLLIVAVTLAGAATSLPNTFIGVVKG